MPEINLPLPSQYITGMGAAKDHWKRRKKKNSMKEKRIRIGFCFLLYLLRVFHLRFKRQHEEEEIET
ncbi:CLUMA_CG004430, isoform A [Clunio marinus]|uniref:CLUMA_CG004430, isoform A n=1 Tax=Clunio marinus TaxID=568069 RepID=A0A1J1HT53_9DIPT|nr:CLUMA_CG004430, isoform A [Clunio marinus]